jgi:hypothetical protein
VVVNHNPFAVGGSLALSAPAGAVRSAAASRVRRVSLGKRALVARAGARKRVKLKLSGRGMRALRRRGRLRVQAVLTLKDPSGARRRTSRKLVLVRGRKR